MIWGMNCFVSTNKGRIIRCLRQTVSWKLYLHCDLTTNMMFFGSQWQKLSDHEVMNLWMIHTWDYHYHRVDGTNPAPVDMVNIPFFLEFHTCQVVQDFFHQQWVYFRFFRIPQPKSLQGFHPKIPPSRRFGIGPWKVMGTKIMELQPEIVSIWMFPKIGVPPNHPF